MNSTDFKELDIESKVKSNVVKKPNKKVSKESNKVNNINTSDDRIKVLEGQIKDLQKQINLINNRLDNNSITTNVVIDTTSIIHSSIDSYDRNDTTSSHYRIYTDIQEEFKKFCKDNRQYKVQDIISSAIREYLDKYNK